MTKIVDLPRVSTCCATSVEFLRHIHLSLRQGTTYRSMTSDSRSFNHILNVSGELLQGDRPILAKK